MTRIDWAFTADGDLGLGDPAVDETGALLFKHDDGRIDTERGDDGRKVRDVGVAEDLEAEKQTILNRLRTDAPDWYHHPGMGGNLSDLIGEPNSRKTGEAGAVSIKRALTYKNLYTPNQVNVRPVPISPERILFLIDVLKYGNDLIRLPLVFHLDTGLLDYYEADAT